MRRHIDGFALLEAMLAILVFSVGLLAILMLLSVSLLEVGNARYRSQASLLASGVIADMWTADRSVQNLRARFGNANASAYQRWLASVVATLPGVTANANQPVITIDDDRTVSISMQWQAPGEATAHRLLVRTTITD